MMGPSNTFLFALFLIFLTVTFSDFAFAGEPKEQQGTELGSSQDTLEEQDAETLDYLFELISLNVTTASKKEETLEDAPGVISVVTKKEIEMFGATSPRDLLERVTSVYGFTGFNHRNEISMRGLSHNFWQREVLGTPQTTRL